MKHSKIFQSIQILVIIGLLAPSAAILGQKSLAQKAVATAKQTYKTTKPTAQQIIAQAKKRAQAAIQTAKKKFSTSKKQARQLTARELSSIKLGIDATQKKLRGQALTEAEKQAMKTFAQYSGAVLAIIAVAAGIGASIYLGTKKDSRPETELPLTFEEQIIERINEQGILQKEKELIAKLYHEEGTVSEAIYQASLQAKIIPPSKEYTPLPIDPRIGDTTKGTQPFAQHGALPANGGISSTQLETQKEKLRKTERTAVKKEMQLTPEQEKILKRRKAIAPEEDDDDDESEEFEF